MAITNYWSIISLNKATTEELTNVVVRVDWRYYGTDENGITGDFTSTTEFNISEVNTGTFVPYDQLTESIVAGWVEAKVNADIALKNYIDETINLIIEHKKTYVTTTELPWNQ